MSTSNPKADMDRLLAYRNLLTAEDHTHELMDHAESSEELMFLEGALYQTIWLRDNCMPEEADSRFHCLVKHYATAYEAMREAWKASRDPQDKIVMQNIKALLDDYLEKLWQRKIVTCERCSNDYGRIPNETGGDAPDRVNNGEPRGTIQAISESRGDVVPAAEVSDSLREATFADARLYKGR